MLVLDVKVGRGSFQANIEEGRLLAQTLVSWLIHRPTFGLPISDSWFMIYAV